MDKGIPMLAFHDHNIRRVLHDGEWWFVILDVVAALTDSKAGPPLVRNGGS